VGYINRPRQNPKSLTSCLVSTTEGLFITICLISILSLLFASCNRIHVIPPAPQLFSLAPSQITADDLYREFRKDAQAATAKYKDKGIWITEARVDAFSPDSNNYIAISTTRATLVSSDKWLFNTIHSDQKFEVGDVVEFVGTCRGLDSQSIIIEIQWISKTGISTATTASSGY
jgi:hypothetical protein